MISKMMYNIIDILVYLIVPDRRNPADNILSNKLSNVHKFSCTTKINPDAAKLITAMNMHPLSRGTQQQNFFTILMNLKKCLKRIQSIYSFSCHFDEHVGCNEYVS